MPVPPVQKRFAELCELSTQAPNYDIGDEVIATQISGSDGSLTLGKTYLVTGLYKLGGGYNTKLAGIAFNFVSARFIKAESEEETIDKFLKGEKTDYSTFQAILRRITD